MIQAPKKPTTPTVTYEHAELELMHAKLTRVELWAKQGAWRESGSDKLFEILRSKS